MKYLIETSYPKTKFWERVKNIFKPGWYGCVPYFEASYMTTDGIGRQHMRLTIKNSGDSSIDGNTIAYAHVPYNYRLISNKTLDKVINLVENGEDGRAINYLKSIKDGLV